MAERPFRVWGRMEVRNAFLQVELSLPLSLLSLIQVRGEPLGWGTKGQPHYLSLSLDSTPHLRRPRDTPREGPRDIRNYHFPTCLSPDTKTLNWLDLRFVWEWRVPAWTWEEDADFNSTGEYHLYWGKGRNNSNHFTLLRTIISTTFLKNQSQLVPLQNSSP